VVRTGRGCRVKILVGVLAVVGLFAFASSAVAASFTNGGFETGDFTGWTVVNQAGSSGNWYVYTGTTSPASGATIAAPPEGTHAATSDQTNPGSHQLYQDVTLEPGAKQTLTFTLYYKNNAGSFASPSTLDYNTFPNQQYRVDVMKPSAPVNSVAPGDVLKNLFQTQPGDPNTLAPTVMSFDLSQFAGQTVRLRFAETDNQGTFQASVDAVRIVSGPTVVTGPASGVSSTSATVNGTVNPNGQATSYHFDYGTSTAYGSSTATQSAGSGTTTSPVSANLTGLTPGTTYHFRLVGQSAGGTSLGADNTFTTPAPPAVVTGPASGVSSTLATVNGTVNPQGQPTSYHFQYGTTTGYGSLTATMNAGSGTTNVAVLAKLAGLKPGTTYHYRLVAQNATGTATGGDRTFTTTIRPLKLAIHASSTPRAGIRTCYALTLTSMGRAVAGGTVRLAGRTTHTARTGHARICTTLSAGLHTLRATKSGYRTFNGRLLVRPAPAPPRLTG
jgi:hypothetical protein